MSLSIYGDRNNQKLILSQACSQVCDKMTSIGLLWVVAELGGASAVPKFLACAGLPHILLSPVGARAIARFGALRLVVSTDLFRGLIYLVAAAMLFAGGVSPSMPMLITLVVLTNLAAALFNPSIFTLPMKMAEGSALVSLNAALTTGFSLAGVIGPLAAIAIYAKGNLAALFLITAFAYLGAAFLGSRIRIKPSSAGEAASSPPLLEVTRNLDGVILLMLLLFLGMNMLLAPAQVAMPVYAKDHLGGSIHALAALEFAMGAGMIAGAFLLSLFQLPGSRIRQSSAALVFMAICYLGFAFTFSLALSSLACLGVGLAVGVANVLIMSEFQARPLPHYVPTVMVMVNTISVASVPISMSLSSLILERWSVPQLTQYSAVALLLLTLSSAAALTVAERRSRVD